MCLSSEQICFEFSDEPVLSDASGDIKQVEQDETVIIRRPANHNEISLMENDWALIKDKINSISLQNGFDFSAVIVGAFIPYAIDIISDYVAKKTPNFFPLAVCVILLVVVKFLGKFIPWMGEDNLVENRVHLGDLKKIITKVDSAKQANGK